MAHITADRVRDTSTTTGTGSITVSGTAPTAFRTFSAVCSTNDTFYYAIQHQTAAEWEVGLGTYSSANTIARTTVYASSASGSAVSFSAGTKDVFITLAATRTVQLNNDGAIEGITDAGNLTFTGTGRRITGDFSNATVANRVAFQTSTTNANSTLYLLPNGTGSQGQYVATNSSDQGASTSLGCTVAMLVNANEARFTSGRVSGSATFLPMTFYTGGSERMRVDTSGRVLIGQTTGTNKLEITGSFGRGAPITKTGNFTLGDAENWIICNGAGSITVTFPAASSWTGREVTIKTIAAQTVVSASSNVVPIGSATAGTAILAATAGVWATLVSDGTNWVIMKS